jgi:hypothetical protein
MSKYIKVSLFSLFFLFGSFSLCFAEDITITTYYPAPYGVYQELRLFPHSAPITVCNDDHKGVMYYDFDDDELKVCRGDAAGWLANDYWVLELEGGDWDSSPGVQAQSG